MKRFLFWALFTVAILLAQPRRELYVLSVCYWEPEGSTYGRECDDERIALYRVDERQASLELVRRMSPHSTSINAVLSSDPMRRIMIVSPQFNPADVDVIDMDRPRSHIEPHHFALRGFEAFTPYFFDTGNRAGYFALEMVNEDFAEPTSKEADHRRVLAGIALDGTEQQELPWEALSGLSLTGTSNYGYNRDNSVHVIVDPQGLISFPHKNAEPARTPWKLPPAWVKRDVQWMFIVANTPEVLVVRYSQSIFLILDKHTSAWKPLWLPGWNTTVVRAFSPWVALELERRQNHSLAYRRGPGLAARKATARQMNYSPRCRGCYSNGSDFDDDMISDGKYRPGTLLLYNLPLAKIFKLETHQSDSEVLFADANTVYYRSNDSIWKVEPEGNSLSAPKRVVRDPKLIDAHWAFFGPASQTEEGR